MIECPNCQWSFEPPPGATTARCPNCYTVVRRRRPVATAVLEAAEPPAVCPLHPGNEAVAICRRCGDYICAVCRTRWWQTAYCAGCVEHLGTETSLAARELFREHRQAAILSVLFGLGGWVAMFPFMLLGFAIAQSDADLGEQARAILIAMMVVCGQVAGLGAIGTGLAAAALRTRGDYMILAGIGLVVSALLVGLSLTLFVSVLFGWASR